MRQYRKYTHKGANFRICSDGYDRIVSEIVHQRRVLSEYISRQPLFLSALEPIELLPEAPEIAVRMHQASLKTGIGPMAAVAGVSAQLAAEAALKAGSEEAIVENGGDIYISARDQVVIGLYAGASPLSGKLGFAVDTDRMPLAICSSSGKMGHSFSFSDCDLATVAAKNAALADAAATLACNLAESERVIDSVMEHITNIPGIDGVLIIKDDKIGVAGDLPEIVKHTDSRFSSKITRDKGSGARAR